MTYKKGKLALIAGFGRFGSGKVVSLSKSFVEETLCTNGLRFLDLSDVLEIKAEKVIFQPSIGYNSLIRDFFIKTILILMKKKIYILILCDDKLAYKFWRVLLYKFVISKGTRQIFSLRNFKDFNCTLVKAHNNIVTRTVPLVEGCNLELCHIVFANYKSKIKGLQRYVEYISELKNDNIKTTIIGAGKSSIKSQAVDVVTNDHRQFIAEMEACVEAGDVCFWFFGSEVDLLPLVMFEALELGYYVLALKESKSDRLLKQMCSEQFWVNEDFFDLSPLNRENLLKEKEQIIIRFLAEYNSRKNVNEYIEVLSNEK